MRLIETLDAVLFDLDGTLLNTFDFIYGAFGHALRTHGAPELTREQIAALMGKQLEQVYTLMAPGHDAAALSATHRAYQSDHLHLVELFPSTVHVLETLTSRGIRIAAVTTRSNRTSVRSLEVTGIRRFFDVVISAEDVTSHKPHPEPLEMALSALGVAPARAIMVGDTHVDIGGARNAGVRSVAALYGFGGEELEQLHPDHVIRDLSELLLLEAS